MTKKARAETTFLPGGADVWAGWEHLIKMRDDLESDQIAEQALPLEKRSVELDQLLEEIWTEEPALLAVGARDRRISDKLRDDIVQGLRSRAEPGREFATIRRFLEVIDAGRRTGRFRMRIPHIPVPTPPSPRSPFQHIDFERYIAFLPTLDAFERSLCDSGPLSADARWGQVMFSALVYGGLLQAKWLLALPEALRRAEPAMRWLYLRPPAIGEDEAPPEPRRWFPDPLTRFLLIRMRIDRYPEATAGSRANYHHVMKLMRAYARERDFLDRFPSGFRGLSVPATTRLHLHAPPWAVAYATGLRNSSSLPEWAWDRLIHPPTRVAAELTPRERIRTPRQTVQEEDGPAEVDDDLGMPEQLRALGSEILKGDEGLLARIKAWRERENERLLPSIRLLAEWLCKEVISSGRGRRARKYRTAYQMINSAGSRFVGQLGGIDPLEIRDEGAFIEWYQNALEDAPSVGLRRKVARVLRSFHDFLVVKSAGQVPSVLESGIFNVTGKGGGIVDANVIGLDTFFRAVVLLRQRAKDKHGSQTATALSLITAIAYFGGLRRSEVLGLRVEDLELADDGCLFVRPNAVRGLKTRSAFRLLPMRLLMAPAEWERLAQFVRVRLKKADDRQVWMFPEFVGASRVKDTAPKLSLITDALQRAADDETLRFHHLRHSFATWSVFKFWIAESGGKETLPQWFLPTSHDRVRWDVSIRERDALLGCANTTRRGLLQVSQLLGHSGADITLSSYFHLADFLLGRFVRRITPNLSIAELLALTGRSPDYLVRLRRQTKPLPSDAENPVAELLTVLADNEQGTGRARSDEGVTERVDFKRLTEVRAPATPFSYLIHFAEALHACTFAKVFDVAQRFGLQEARLTEALSVLETRQSAYLVESGGDGPKADPLADIQLPNGEMQNAFARDTVNVLVALHQGKCASGVPLRTVRDELRMVLERFPEQWVRGSALTTRFDTLPDAKRWIWLLSKLGFEQGVVVRHIYGKVEGKSFPATARQMAYWAKRLGLKVEAASDIVPSGMTRGSVLLSVDLGKVPENACRYRKESGLAGVRFALMCAALVGVSALPGFR